MTTFMAYAADFEESYKDDDWSRLLRHFSDDAVYEVRSEVIGCELVGPKAIVAGLRKSVDGFDRRFDSREIELVEGPEVVDGELRATWNVHYEKEGVQPFTLRGKSTVRCAGGVVTRLVDIYERQAEEEMAEWQRHNDLDIDPSYT